MSETNQSDQANPVPVGLNHDDALEKIMHLVRDGDHKNLDQWLDRYPELLAHQDKRGNTPLHELIQCSVDKPENTDIYFQVSQNLLSGFLLKFALRARFYLISFVLSSMQFCQSTDWSGL